MKPNRAFSSPNYDPIEIAVEFLVLHYTAGDLASTLDLFLDPAQEVSAHLILAEDGEVFELVPCWNGVVYKAWHAGRSSWVDSQQRWEEFNNFSIGIEMVNLNGNLFPYSERQYQALAEVTKHLRSNYEALNSPERIVGHEQIAGGRGKVDPGHHFDWPTFYEQNYPGMEYPTRENICQPELAQSFGKFREVSQGQETPSRFWHAVSHAMETASRLIQNSNLS
jgi:N-acetyl-anhydromuramyl-L-alanine amidase AmpD